MFAVKEVAHTNPILVRRRASPRHRSVYSVVFLSACLLILAGGTKVSETQYAVQTVYIQEYLKCPLTCSRLNCHGSIFLGRGHMDICRYASLPTEALYFLQFPIYFIYGSSVTI